MARKIKNLKEEKQKKLKQKENFIIGTQVAFDNHSYYIMLHSLWKIGDMLKKEFKLKNQIENGKITQLHHDILLEQCWNWEEITTRLYNIVSKQAEKMNDITTVAARDEKIIIVAYATAKHFYLTLYNKYGICAKSKYKEVTNAVNFIFRIIAWFTVVKDCAYSSELDMDIKERKAIRYLLTRFYNTTQTIALNMFNEEMRIIENQNKVV